MNNKSYKRYLQSDKWAMIRNAIIERDNFKCTVCDSPDNLHVHHLTYENVGNEKDEDLITLCRGCHFKETTDDVSHITEELLVNGMRNLNIYRVYKKVFHNQDPSFSKDTYYKYWYNLCRHLSRHTNIVISRKPTIHFIHEIQDFEAICGSNKSTNYRFIKECKDKNLLTTFIFSDKNIFIANPLYVLCGNKMPMILVKLFNDISTEMTSKKPL